MNRSALPTAALVVVLSFGALTGCTSQGSQLADDYKAGAGGGYVSGDGTVRVVAEGERDAAIAFAGDTDTGESVSSDDLTGRVVVLNFWYAACPPCRTEAPDLVALAEGYADDDVDFLGVNVQDSAATARSFAARFGIPYPSILDAAENDVQLAFAGEVPPNAVPTTLVIDRQGRVAARFSGLIQSPSTLGDVIDDALAEPAP